MLQGSAPLRYLKDVFREAKNTQPAFLCGLHHLSGRTADHMAVKIGRDGHRVSFAYSKRVVRSSPIDCGSLPVRKRSLLNGSIGRVVLLPSRISSVSNFAAIGACMKPCPEKPQAQRKPSIAVLPRIGCSSGVIS